MPDLTGQTIGNYRIDALLGVGGMGQVFRATHLLLNRPAAIKVLHEQYAADPTFQARFQQEARAAAALRHPNIVEIIDFGQSDGRYYLVMELVSDGSVRTLLQQRAGAGTPLALPLGVDLVRQAAAGLGYAHSQGMVHRDIKPDNLLVSRGGNGPVGPSGYNVKLTDFGLARLAEGGVATAHGATMGTPAYMSPEQCQAIDLDGRSDIYSLGVVLYEVATGYLPFETKSLSDAVYKHVYTEPPPPKQVKPDLPDALEAIILRCLRKAPDERFQSAAALAEALTALYATLGAAVTSSEDRPTQMGRVEGIQVLLDRQSYPVSPGVPTQLRLTVANLGQVPVPIDLTIEGVPPEWITLPGAPLQVTAGAPQLLALQVLVPRDAAVAAGARPLTITGRSRANPPQSASATATLTVQPFSVDEASLEPARVKGRGGGTTTLVLNNGGNQPMSWNIQAVGGAPEISVDAPPPTAAVAAGSSARVPIRVHAARRWTGGEKSLPFAVQAAPVGGQTRNLPGELVQPIVAPIWASVLAIVALLALVGGGVAYAMRGGGATPAATPTVALVVITATAAPEATATNPPPATPTVSPLDTATAPPEEFTPTIPAGESPTVPLVVVDTPTVAPAAGRILFAANLGTPPGTLEVMTIASDGTDEQRLTDNEFDDWGAQWSPDGTAIAYVHSVTLSDGSSNSNVWVMDSDGGNKQQLTNASGANEFPIWSPDGTKLVYSSTRDGNNELYVLDLASRTETNITQSDSGEYTPNWSPDSTQVAFTSSRSGGNDIYVTNADGSGDAVRLTTDADSDSLPVYSPDGAKICFVRGNSQTHSLVVMNADGSGEQEIATDVADQPDTEWSPDGAQIAYVGLAAGNPDIFVVGPDGADQSRIQLTVDSAADTAPAWSPDGTLIAFLSTRDGVMAGDGQGPVKQLWLMNADGSGQTGLTSEPAEHWYPDWRPGG